MKRITIGGIIMLGGILISSSIIIAASIYVPSITQWTGKSKLWYAIFGGKQYGNEVGQSLFLGFPFVAGVALTVLGLLILGYEYYKLFKDGGF